MYDTIGKLDSQVCEASYNNFNEFRHKTSSEGDYVSNYRADTDRDIKRPVWFHDRQRYEGHNLYVKKISRTNDREQKDDYVSFIDYSKAFDTIKHEPLLELIHSLDIDLQDVKRLANLYWNQQAAVKHNG